MAPGIPGGTPRKTPNLSPDRVVKLWCNCYAAVQVKGCLCQANLASVLVTTPVSVRGLQKAKHGAPRMHLTQLQHVMRSQASVLPALAVRITASCW